MTGSPVPGAASRSSAVSSSQGWLRSTFSERMRSIARLRAIAASQAIGWPASGENRSAFCQILTISLLQNLLRHRPVTCNTQHDAEEFWRGRLVKRAKRRVVTAGCRLQQVLQRAPGRGRSLVQASARFRDARITSTGSWRYPSACKARQRPSTCGFQRLPDRRRDARGSRCPAPGARHLLGGSSSPARSSPGSTPSAWSIRATRSSRRSAGSLYQLTEPALRPIRRFVPMFGGLDISPIILLLIVFLIQRIIIYYVYPYVF